MGARKDAIVPKYHTKSRREFDAPQNGETLPAPMDPVVTEKEKDVQNGSSGDASDEEWKDFGFLPIPARVRYHPKSPAHFGLIMNVTFGIASTFSTLVRL